jgi:hypothetical protein
MLFYFFVVPHNAEVRFLVPALFACLIGLALILEFAYRKGKIAGFITYFLLLILLFFSARPDKVLAGTLHIITETGGGAGAWLFAGAGALLLVTAVRLAPGIHRRLARMLIAALALFFLLRGSELADQGRAVVVARAPYALMKDGYLRYQLPPYRPKRIAYCGANIAYTLMGPHWQNVVVYCNTQGRLSDGFYEFWSEDRRVYKYHKPGIYRGRDSFQKWLEHLSEERIEEVVVFSMGSPERKQIASDFQGFPLERVWMASHPEEFEIIGRWPRAEIYRFKTQPR